MSEFERTAALGARRRAWQARQRSTGELVHLREAGSRRDALREARLLRRAGGVFSPAFRRIVQEGDRYWIATDWIDGRTLGDHVAGTAVPPGSWPTNLTRALAHLHRCGIVHGDLKPANVMCRPDGQIRLVDLEFARRVGDEPGFTEAGGTVGFVAPERLSGWPADPRSDLYSLGIVLRAHGGAAPLTDVIDSLCASRPTDRPPSADQVLDRIASTCGRGIVPEPDLRLVGWRRQAISSEELALGLMRHLGADRMTAVQLASELLRGSGGEREVAQGIWSVWLSLAAPDPWCAQPRAHWREALSSLVETAREQAQRRFLSGPPRLRREAAIVAQLGECFPADDLRCLDGVIATLGAGCDGGALEATRGEEALGTAGGGVDGNTGMRSMDTESIADGGGRKGDEMDARGAGSRWEAVVTAGWLRPRPGLRLSNAGSHASELAFATPYLWEAARGALDPPTAQRIHRGLAEELALLSDRVDGPRRTDRIDEGAPARWSHVDERIGRTARVAAHWEAAGEVLAARRSFWEAGAMAFSRGQNGLAAEYITRGRACSELAGSPDPEAPSMERRLEFALALSFAGRPVDAESWLADATPPGVTHPGACRVRADILARKRRFDDALVEVEAGLGALDPSADDDVTTRLRGQLLLGKAWALQELKRPGEAEIAATAASAHLARVGDRRSLATTEEILGAIAYARAELVAARSHWERSLELACEGGFPFPEAVAHIDLGAVDNREGRFEATAEHLRTAREIARRSRFRMLAWTCTVNLGVLYQSLEDWESAARHWTEGLEMAREEGDPGQALAASAAIGRMETFMGRLPAAERTLREGLRIAGDHAHPGEELRVLLRLVELFVWYRRRPADPGLLEAARRLASRREDPRERGELATVEALDALLTGATPESALELLGPPPLPRDDYGWHLLATARIRLAAGDPAGARAACTEAHAAFSTQRPSRYPCAFSLLERARIGAPGAGAEDLADLGACIDLARAVRSRAVEAEALILRAARLSDGALRSQVASQPASRSHEGRDR